MLNTFLSVIQILGALGGVAAIGMFIRTVYLLRTDKLSKQTETKGVQESALIKLLTESHPEIARLAKRLQEQDEYITDLEERVLAFRRKNLEQALELEALSAKFEQLDSQLSKALVELDTYRRSAAE